MVAADDNAAVNPKSASATVIINITRDKQPPNFVADPYVTTVTYDIPFGTSIYQATATDPDLIVSTHADKGNGKVSFIPSQISGSTASVNFGITK